MPAYVQTLPMAAVPAASKAERVLSFDLADHPQPTGREEDWRFTPVKTLQALLDDVPSPAHLGWATSLPEGVTLTELSADEARARAVAPPVDRAAALAVTHSGGARLLTVPAEATPESPVRLDLRGTGPAVVWGHLLVEIGAHAKVTIVVDHGGLAQYSHQLSLRVGDGADVTLVLMQRWEDDAVHLGHVAARIGRDARLHATDVTLGGKLVRLSHTVEYDGPGGDAELLGLFFADPGQHLEHRLFVDHAVPDCCSYVEYKGALQGDDARGRAGIARSVWIGDVLIRAAATGTSTYEMNRNLLLTDNARADSVPNLEIETGQIIGAGHASATGRFDDEQLFYLQARGIPQEEARRLVVRGFFAELVERIGVADVQTEVLAALDAELGETGERE